MGMNPWTGSVCASSRLHSTRMEDGGSFDKEEDPWIKKGALGMGRRMFGWVALVYNMILIN